MEAKGNTNDRYLPRMNRKMVTETSKKSGPVFLTHHGQIQLGAWLWLWELGGLRSPSGRGAGAEALPAEIFSLEALLFIFSQKTGVRKQVDGSRVRNASGSRKLRSGSDEIRISAARLIAHCQPFISPLLSAPAVHNCSHAYTSPSVSYAANGMRESHESLRILRNCWPQRELSTLRQFSARLFL